MDDHLSKLLAGISADQLNSILKKASTNTDADPEQIMNSLKQNENTDKINQVLKTIDQSKIHDLLKDQKSLDALLKSDQAKKVIQTLLNQRKKT